MNIIRIIEITDTGRLAKELRKEGWTPDTDETGRWRKDGTVFRLTDSGFHAYIGPDEQCPPFDDIDMLEPVDHGIYEIPGKGTPNRMHVHCSPTPPTRNSCGTIRSPQECAPPT